MDQNNTSRVDLYLQNIPYSASLGILMFSIVLAPPILIYYIYAVEFLVLLKITSYFALIIFSILFFLSLFSPSDYIDEDILEMFLLSVIFLLFIAHLPEIRWW